MLVFTVLLWAATAVKVFQLLRAPDDPMLRTVAGGLAAAALAFTAGRAPVEAGLNRITLGLPSLLQNIGMNLAFLTLLAFFVYSSHGRDSAAREMRWHRAVVLVVLVLLCLVWMTAPAAVRAAPRDAAGDGVVHGALFQLCSVAALLYSLIAAVPHAARRARRVQQRHLRIGLRIVAVGLGAAVVANLLSASSTVSGLLLGAGNEVVPWLRLVYLGAIVVAIPGLAIGLSLPILVSMTAAVPLWRRHWQEYRALRPLWKRVHRAFPKVALRRPIGAVRPWSIHARRYRRACEIRDGLLMLAPYYPVHSGAASSTIDTHAAIVEEALRARAEALEDGSEAIGGPITTPIPQGENTKTLDDDIRWLVELSQAIYRPGATPAVQS
ncbi:hypothetical protein OOZ19_04300 [Saccharopolyspora sp. NFXS83]|uniref:MAB_1171c family putative transporter n=1 Tax=Saccharopolyspora sp. NFXS83 TaxID=2993560 RepID=UPI00224B1E42|nr:MAB_1171c family putative transporter [Saccharopolyspora sp. NFXS83]MCX2729450.1 hypothetical protein [Saccharopolyspora sp. NFXS83]